ncbi:MAG TPA: cupin domain-containing protein [Mycobacterium sp.]|nr:cupin domain-containing protein [Mycobacterium sp.]
MDLDRRSVLVATFLMAAIAGCEKSGIGPALNSTATTRRHAPDPNETFVLPREKIEFQAWGNLPPRSGEMALLYGDFNKPGPYLVMMRWNPGWFSAPHTYATDRICVVMSGTWYVNSGDDFLPDDAVPVGPGGYVKRAARTPHYDGVLRGQPDPAVIAIFGVGPVDLQLVDPTKPSWRQV